MGQLTQTHGAARKTPFPRKSKNARSSASSILEFESSRPDQKSRNSGPVFRAFFAYGGIRALRLSPVNQLAARNLFEANDRELPLVDAGQRHEVAGAANPNRTILERVRREQRAARRERRTAAVYNRQLDERVQRAIGAAERRAASVE